MKIVREHINEKFTEDSDPIKDMNIGIKTYLTKKLNLVYDKQLPIEFEGKNYCMVDAREPHDEYYNFDNDDDNIYEDLNFFGFKKVGDELCIIGAWSKYEFEEEQFYTLYPVEQFLEDEVKESLNEKFTEESDPVHDMGIGIMKEIRDFLKVRDINMVIVHPLVIINEFIKNDKYDYADFFIDYKHVDINGPLANYGYLLRNAVYTNNFERQKYLIRKGANLEETIKQTIESMTPITYRKLIELKSKLEYEDS